MRREVRDGWDRGQRRAACPGRRAAAHQRARLPARLRADRRQGGLRRGRVRRLLGAGRPPGAGRVRGDRVDRDQLLPGAGRGARRPGGRHRRGARLARRAAPRPARDGGARRFAVRLLHARLRLQHGGRVLPHRPGRHNGSGPRDHYHGPNGFDLHAVSGNLCRCTGYRPIQDAAFALGPPGRRRRARGPSYGARTGAVPTQLHDGEAAFVRPASLAEALQLLPDHERRGRRRRQHRLGRRRQPPGRAGRAASSRSTGSRSCAGSRSPTTRSGSAPPSRSPRSSAGWTAGCRCWRR